MPQDLFVEVGGARVRYWQQGETGSPVLLLHGIACSVLEWKHNIDALAKHHRVYAVDLLGFGLSDKPANESYSLDSLAEFVFRFMDAVNLGEAHLAGNSLGSRLALKCAANEPGRVTSLLLTDPAGMARRGTLFEFRLTTLSFLGELLSRPTSFGIRMLWRKAFANPDAFVTDDLVATKVSMASAPGALAAFLKTLRGFVDLQGFRPETVAQLHQEMPRIEAPCLVVWGREDQFVPVEHAQVLRESVANVEVQVWDNCGHVPQIECASRFNQTALDFWNPAG